MKPTPIKPMGVSVNDSIGKRLVRWVLTALLTVGFSLFFAVLFIEWMAGCGETYVDANGVRHQYECVFIPQPN
jgi:hypothetical protein